jgi:hypothetical protein
MVVDKYLKKRFCKVWWQHQTLQNLFLKYLSPTIAVEWAEFQLRIWEALVSRHGGTPDLYTAALCHFQTSAA